MKWVITYSAWTILAMILVAIAPSLSCEAQGLETAPEFSLNDLQGIKHTLSEYHGKVVVINFWASWCHECTEELPSLVTLFETFKGRGLIVLGIATDQKRDPVEPLLKKYRVNYPVMLNTAGGQLLKQYRIIGLPSTVVINGNGAIAERSVGRTDFGSSDFIRKIEMLLGSAKKDMRGR